MRGLAYLMKKHSDTLASLAIVFNVDENTIWRWKAGVSTPKVEIMRKICERYNCSFDDLLNPTPPSGS